MKLYKDNNNLLRTDRLKYNLKSIKEETIIDNNDNTVYLLIAVLLFFVIK